MKLDQSRRLSQGLLRAGAAAGPLFVSAFVVEGATRPGYDAARYQVSALSLGPHGWRQQVNFWVAGGLYLAGAVGLWRSRSQPGFQTTAGPILVSTVGLGLLGAGAFAMDPLDGYPSGAVAPQAQTRTGRLHDLCSSPVFLCLPAGAFVYAHAAARTHQRGWTAVSIGAAAVQLATFVVAGLGFNGRPALVSRAGVFQRLSIASGFGWLSALCWRASVPTQRSRRRPPETRDRLTARRRQPPGSSARRTGADAMTTS